jgi:hypothetical protein
MQNALVPIRGDALERRTQAQEFGERDDDVMNDTARRSKTIAHSAMGQEPRARPLDREPRVVGLHQGQRTQSAPTGRTYDRRPPAVHRRNKNAYDPLENSIDVKRSSPTASVDGKARSP